MSEEYFRIAELLGEHPIVMLTSLDAEGVFESRPMTVQEIENDHTLWLFAPADGHAVAQLRADPRFNLAYAHGSFLSLSGRAEVVVDAERAARLWNPAVEAWMQCEPSDPRVCLLKLDAESAQYWKSPGAVPVALSMVKAKLTGRQPDVGESGTVEL